MPAAGPGGKSPRFGTRRSRESVESLKKGDATISDDTPTIGALTDFLARLRPRPGCRVPHKDFGRFLKTLGRYYHLDCVSAVEIARETPLITPEK